MVCIGVNHSVFTYKNNDLVGFTISIVGTIADLTVYYVPSNTPVLKKVTKLANFISVKSKIIVNYIYITEDPRWYYPFHK